MDSHLNWVLHLISFYSHRPSYKWPPAIPTPSPVLLDIPYDTWSVESYSLRPKILVKEINVSRHILVLYTFTFIHFCDKYFRTEGVFGIPQVLGELDAQTPILVSFPSPMSQLIKPFAVHSSTVADHLLTEWRWGWIWLIKDNYLGHGSGLAPFVRPATLQIGPSCVRFYVEYISII